MNPENIDLDGKIPLGKTTAGEWKPLKLNAEGELMVAGTGGGGGGSVPAHASTHLPGGDDPIQLATTERYGLTKLTASLTEGATELAANGAAVKIVNDKYNVLATEVDDTNSVLFNLNGKVENNSTTIDGLEINQTIMQNKVSELTLISNENETDIIKLESQMKSLQLQDINMLKNGSGELGLVGWNNVGVGAFNATSDRNGTTYISYEVATTSSYGLLDSDAILVYANQTYNLSLEFYQSGFSNALSIEILNSTNDASLGAIAAPSNAMWERVNANFSTGNATSIKLRLVVGINKGASLKAWRRMQLTFGSGMKAWNNFSDFTLFKAIQMYQLTSNLGHNKLISATNLNSLTKNGFYVGDQLINSPINGSGQWYYIEVQVLSQDERFVKQIARHLHSNTYQERTCISGTWTNWTVDVFNVVGWIEPGTGSPEGILSRPVGSLYLRKDGGVNTTLYVKQSGNGNVGWAAK